MPDPYNLSVAGIVREAAPEPNPAKGLLPSSSALAFDFSYSNLSMLVGLFVVSFTSALTFS